MKNNNFTITILSAKGGVGKTMLTASLIHLLAKDGFKINCVDADVNAPNLALWLGMTERWDKYLPVKIFPLPNKYKKCKKLQLVCDGKLIDIKDEPRGEVKIKENFSPKFGKYKMNIIAGSIDENKTGSGKVVEEVVNLIEKYQAEINIIDTAPGTGYPVITPLKKSNFAILITEPTILGFTDLKKLVTIAKLNNKNYGVVINKYEVDVEFSEKIKKWLGKNFLGEISYSAEINQDLIDRVPVTINESKTSQQINNIYKLILSKKINIEK